MLKNNTINVSVYLGSITNSLFDLPAIKELSSLMTDKEFGKKYTFCLYSDFDVLHNNIFIPVFHTMYLSCKKNNVILTGSDDVWLLSGYSNNNYYFLETDDIPESIKSESKIKIIKSIKDIV